MDYVSMGKRIADRRHLLGLSQEFVAREIQRSVSFVGHIERGTRIPGVDTIAAIANALDMSLDDMFIDSLKKHNLPAPQQHAKLEALMADTMTKIEELYTDWDAKRLPAGRRTVSGLNQPTV